MVGAGRVTWPRPPTTASQDNAGAGHRLCCQPRALTTGAKCRGPKAEGQPRAAKTQQRRLRKYFDELSKRINTKAKPPNEQNIKISNKGRGSGQQLLFCLRLPTICGQHCLWGLHPRTQSACSPRMTSDLWSTHAVSRSHRDGERSQCGANVPEHGAAPCTTPLIHRQARKTVLMLREGRGQSGGLPGSRLPGVSTRLVRSH